MSRPDYAEQYDRLIRELREQGLLTDPDPMPDGPEFGFRYGCVTWAICQAAGLFCGAAFLALLLGLLDRHAVVTAVGLVASLPGLLIARQALRRLHVEYAAQRRRDEWTARQPGGREELRARLGRTMIRAAVAYATLFVSTALRDPLLGVFSVAVTISLLGLPQVREHIRWYRNLTAEPGGRRPRGRHRRRRTPARAPPAQSTRYGQL